MALWAHPAAAISPSNPYPALSHFRAFSALSSRFSCTFWCCLKLAVFQSFPCTLLHFPWHLLPFGQLGYHIASVITSNKAIGSSPFPPFPLQRPNLLMLSLCALKCAACAHSTSNFKGLCSGPVRPESWSTKACTSVHDHLHIHFFWLSAASYSHSWDCYTCAQTYRHKSAMPPTKMGTHRNSSILQRPAWPPVMLHPLEPVANLREVGLVSHSTDSLAC